MERSKLRESGYRVMAVATIVLVLRAGRFGPAWLLAAVVSGCIAWQLRPSAEDRELQLHADAERSEPRPAWSAVRRDLIILFWLVVLSPVIYVGGWLLLGLLGVKP